MGLGDAPDRSGYIKKGVLEMIFARRGDRSVLAHLYREAPLLAQQALYWDEHLPGLACVYVITTQAATKIHSMDAGHAAQSQRLDLSENAYLELLPGPVIPHRHSRFIAA